MSEQTTNDQSGFFPDIPSQNVFLTKADHETLGQHVFGENVLPPGKPTNSTSGVPSNPGQSDTWPREDHSHMALTQITSAAPVDADYADLQPGITVLDELHATLWVRGTTVWFSVAMTPH